MFYKQHITRHKLGAGDTRDLIKWKVPRLDGEDRADRARDQGGTGKARKMFRLQECRSVLGVIVEDAGREMHFLYGDG